MARTSRFYAVRERLSRARAQVSSQLAATQEAAVPAPASSKSKTPKTSK